MTTIGKINEISTEKYFECKISNFSSLPVENNKYYHSPSFYFAEKSWMLRIYPLAFYKADSNGYVSLYLSQNSSSEIPIKIQFTLGLKTSTGKIYQEIYCTGNFINTEAEIGVNKFLPRSELFEEKLDLLPNDVLTVYCRLMYPRSPEILATVIRKNELLSQELADTKDKLSSLNTEISNLLKRKDDLIREKDKSVIKYEKSSEEFCMKISQLTDQLLAVSQELEKERKESEHLKSAIMRMEKMICELQSAAQDNNWLTVADEKNENAVDTSAAEINVKEDDKPKFTESHESKVFDLHENDAIETKEIGESENAVDVSDAEINVKEDDKPKFTESHESKVFVSHENDTIETTEMGESERTVDVSTAEINIKEADKSRLDESVEPKVFLSNENDTIETKDKATNTSANYSIVTNVNFLLKDRKGVDVNFILETSEGEIEVFAHQLILAVRSSYFADEFYSKERNEKRKIIPLKGVDPKAFQKMIRYCYDCEPELKTTEGVCSLFKVASDFAVISLMKLCTTFLKSTKIEPGNVFRVLEVSEQIQDKSLRDMCFKVLEENTEEVLTSHELCDVTPSMVHIILQLPKLSFNSEYKLIMWILQWAKTKCEGKNLNCKSIRKYLENLLQDMNFLSLTGEEFAKICKDHPDFFTLEEVASLCLNIMLPGTREMPDWYNKNMKLRVYTR